MRRRLGGYRGAVVLGKLQMHHLRMVSVVMAVLIVLAKLAADVICRLLDPRIGAHG
jgi:ABC-type dipeptide/oligopeptide/nickel transport system permease component